MLNQKTKTMKTRSTYTAVLFVLTMLFAVLLQAGNTSTNLADPVNPPGAEPNMEVAEFEEEGYVNDIPFETSEVKANYALNKALSVSFESTEEGFVDDIPFDTEIVAVTTMYTDAVNKVFMNKEEAYVDDIPFDTQHVVKANNCSAQYALHL
jgi:hypothetical protein